MSSKTHQHTQTTDRIVEAARQFSLAITILVVAGILASVTKTYLQPVPPSLFTVGGLLVAGYVTIRWALDDRPRGGE